MIFVNYRQVETSREIRLWITGIVMPVVLGATALLVSNPELAKDVKETVTKKVEDFKRRKKETL